MLISSSSILTNGPFLGRVEAEADRIIIDSRPIAIVSYLNPLDIPWREFGVELVIEATGTFTNADLAVSHLLAGAERVLVTAPSKGAYVTLVVGVNEHSYDQTEHQIISAASCTTNALALIAKVPYEHFGVCYGMTTSGVMPAASLIWPTLSVSVSIVGSARLKRVRLVERVYIERALRMVSFAPEELPL